MKKLLSTSLVAITLISSFCFDSNSLSHMKNISFPKESKINHNVKLQSQQRLAINPFLEYSDFISSNNPEITNEEILNKLETFFKMGSNSYKIFQNLLDAFPNNAENILLSLEKISEKMIEIEFSYLLISKFLQSEEHPKIFRFITPETADIHEIALDLFQTFDQGISSSKVAFIDLFHERISFNSNGRLFTINIPLLFLDRFSEKTGLKQHLNANSYASMLQVDKKDLSIMEEEIKKTFSTTTENMSIEINKNLKNPTDIVFATAFRKLLDLNPNPKEKNFELMEKCVDFALNKCVKNKKEHDIIKNNVINRLVSAKALELSNASLWQVGINGMIEVSSNMPKIGSSGTVNFKFDINQNESFYQDPNLYITMFASGTANGDSNQCGFIASGFNGFRDLVSKVSSDLTREEVKPYVSGNTINILKSNLSMYDRSLKVRNEKIDDQKSLNAWELMAKISGKKGITTVQKFANGDYCAVAGNNVLDTDENIIVLLKPGHYQPVLSVFDYRKQAMFLRHGNRVAMENKKTEPTLIKKVPVEKAPAFKKPEQNKPVVKTAPKSKESLQQEIRKLQEKNYNPQNTSGKSLFRKK